jgi:hypothetical protein
MSYELIKLQSKEGFSYAPGANKNINFDFSEAGVVDMTKSYVILNTSAVVTPDPALVTAAGAGFVQMASVGLLGAEGLLPYKTSSLVRNSRFKSKTNPFYVENRELNLREANLQHYTKDLQDHQQDALYGSGTSVLDSETGRIRSSVFLDKVISGNLVSKVRAPDLIVPLKDLLGDVGDMQLFPAGLMGEMGLELEIEDRFNLIDVSNNLQSEVDITYAAGVATVTDASAALKTLNIRSKFLKNSSDLQDAEFYVGQVLSLEIDNTTGQNPSVKAAASCVVEAINYNTTDAGTDDDGFGVVGGADYVQLTLNKTIGTLVAHVAGADQAVSALKFKTVKTFTGTPTYVINRAELVLARKRLPPNVVQQYFTAVAREGMTYDCYETIAWNRSNTSEVNDFYNLPPMTKFVMNITPSDTPSGKTLYTLIGGMQAYRWTINDTDTTNRDVPVANQMSGIYKHKVKNAIEAAGLTAKSVNNVVIEAMTGQQGTALRIAYPLEYVPVLQMPLLLKLNMKGNAMQLGESFLIYKREKTLSF